MKHDRDVLAEHGTELMTLKPRNVLQAAQADIKRRVRNSEIGNARSGEFRTEGYEFYAFHRNHVARASDAQDLLVRALMDPVPGQKSAKYNTRLLYGNGGLLRQALMLTREAAN